MSIFNLPGKPIYFNRKDKIVVFENDKEVFYYHYTKMGSCKVEDKKSREVLDKLVARIIKNHEEIQGYYN